MGGLLNGGNDEVYTSSLPYGMRHFSFDDLPDLSRAAARSSTHPTPTRHQRIVGTDDLQVERGRDPVSVGVDQLFGDESALVFREAIDYRNRSYVIDFLEYRFTGSRNLRT
jgi:hypothetical protein